MPGPLPGVNLKPYSRTMLTQSSIKLPRQYDQIVKKSEELNFNMLSDLKTGSLLKTLSASKTSGLMLELGTGTGLSLAWIAEGADKTSRIVSIDNNDQYQSVARRFFEDDDRISFECLDANSWLKNYDGEKFDLVFADAFPGKFENLNFALDLVKVGGFYVIDDLFPQPNWPENHQVNVDRLLNDLYKSNEFVFTPFDWSTGLVVFTKIKD